MTKRNDVWIEWRGRADQYYLIKALDNGHRMILCIGELYELQWYCDDLNDSELNYRKDLSA